MERDHSRQVNGHARQPLWPLLSLRRHVGPRLRAGVKCFFTAPPQSGEPQVNGGRGPFEGGSQFRQCGIRALLQPLEQAGLAGGGQKRLASAPVGLRLEGATGFEVLANPAHRRDAVAEAGGDLGRALGLVVELDDTLADSNRDGFHSRSLSPFTVNALHYLCKRSSSYPEVLSEPSWGAFRLTVAVYSR